MGVTPRHRGSARTDTDDLARFGPALLTGGPEPLCVAGRNRVIERLAAQGVYRRPCWCGAVTFADRVSLLGHRQPPERVRAYWFAHRPMAAAGRRSNDHAERPEQGRLGDIKRTFRSASERRLTVPVMAQPADLRTPNADLVALRENAGLSQEDLAGALNQLARRRFGRQVEHRRHDPHPRRPVRGQHAQPATSRRLPHTRRRRPAPGLATPPPAAPSLGGPPTDRHRVATGKSVDPSSYGATSATVATSVPS